MSAPSSSPGNVSPLSGRAVLTLFLFWGLLFVLGFPMPWTDDIWYTGPAFHLLTSGTTANPYCPVTLLLAGTDHFFFNVPVYFYVLAGWLYVFKISHASLAAFQVLGAALTSAALLRLISHNRPSVWLTLAVSFLAACFFGGLGLRPESLGFALFTWGLVGIVRGTPLTWFLGCMALALSVITVASLALTVMVALAAALYLRREHRFSRVISGGLAGALCFLLFLILIGFELPLFLKALQMAGAQAGDATLLAEIQDSLHKSRALFRVLLLAGEPLAVLLLAFALAWFRPQWLDQPIPRRHLVCGLMLVLTAYPAALNSCGALRLPGLMAQLFALYVLIRLRLPEFRWMTVAWVATTAFFFLTAGLGLAQLGTHFFYPVGTSPATWRAAIDKLNPQHLYLDPYALCSVYDYRMPPASTAYSSSLTYIGAWPPPDVFPPGTAILIARQTLCRTSLLPEGSFPQVPLPGFARAYPSAAANPFDLVLIQVYLKPDGSTGWSLVDPAPNSSK